MEVKLGLLKIYFPDSSSSEFFINEDLAEIFGFETSHETAKYVREKLKEKMDSSFKQLKIDYETNGIFITSRKGEVVVEAAIIINELINFKLDNSVITEVIELVKYFKRPKKQKWGIGDIFSIPLLDQTYYFGQIIGEIEDITPICIILNINKNGLLENEELTSADILGALSFIPNNIDNFTFKVINNFPIIRQVTENVRRNPILNSQYSSNCIIDFCEEIKTRGTTSKYWGFIENKNYLK